MKYCAPLECKHFTDENIIAAIFFLFALFAYKCLLSMSDNFHIFLSI